MKNYILIDGSYFIFYRVFALQLWWKNARRDEPLVNPIENEEFVEKFKETFKSKIKEIPKKLKLKDATVIVGKDCFRKNIWRMKLHPQYKEGRNEKKNKEVNIGNFFALTYADKLFENAVAEHVIALDELEADDCLALTAKYLTHKYEDSMVTIITSDHDYIQLANDRISLYNLKYKSLLESKSYCGDPKQALFYKIILGDKSDNIKPIFSKCGIKTAEKYYKDEKLFQEKLMLENKIDIYEINKRLIDFDEIPSNLVELFYNNILSIL